MLYFSIKIKSANNPINRLGSHKVVYIDYNFSTFDEALIYAAGKEWQEKTHNLITFEYKINFDVEKINELKDNPNVLVFIKTNKNDPDLKEIDDVSKGFKTLGLYHYVDGVPAISIASDRLAYHHPDFQEEIFLHEFGHALGLPHIAKQGSLMYFLADKGAYHLSSAGNPLHRFGWRGRNADTYLT